jgi:hypothetical protein
MKKTAYNSRRPEASTPCRSAEIPSASSGEEGLGGEPGHGVGRGYTLPGEPTSAYDGDPEKELLDPPRFRRSRKVDSKALLDLFVMLADEMDGEGEHVMANFADFMIKKIAEQRDLDYSMLFKDLLVKIVESDIVDKNKLIISLVSIFNRALVISANNGATLSKAKLNAYQAAVSRAEEYVR